MYLNFYLLFYLSIFTKIIYLEVSYCVLFRLMENPESASLLIVQCTIALSRRDLETAQNSLAVMGYIAGTVKSLV